MSTFPQPDQLDGQYQSVVGEVSGIIGAARQIQTERFYLLWPSKRILQTASEKSESILQTASAHSSLSRIASSFPLPWSAYVRLLTVKNTRAREFYEAEALRSGWSVRQLDRQIDSQFYERTAVSLDKAACSPMAARRSRRIRSFQKQPSRTLSCFDALLNDSDVRIAAVGRAGMEYASAREHEATLRETTAAVEGRP